MDEHVPHPDSILQKRRALLGARSAGEWLREQVRRSPYLVIAVSLNLLLVGAATLLQLGRDERRDGLSPITDVALRPVAPAAETAAPEPPPSIFETKDPSIDPSERLDPVDPDAVAPAEFVDPTWLEAEVPESAGGDEAGTVKGSDPTSDQLGGVGTGLFDSIGIGAGSVRGADGGGPGGRGTGRGGKIDRGPRRKVGAPARTQDAVRIGLLWLARHQSDDGSWSPERFHARCGGGTACAGDGYPEHEVGLTGLALLAFLGAGHDDHSAESWTDPVTGRRVRAADVVKRGLKWLRAQQDDRGSFGSGAGKWGYNHAVATLAMAEAFGLSQLPVWREPAQRAVDALCAGQSSAAGSTGLAGWRYRPADGESDISVTGWCVMALKSAELAGLRVPRGAMEGALRFCDEVTDAATGQVGYQRREDAGRQVRAPGKNDEYSNHPALEAVGMLVRTFAAHDLEDPMLEAGARRLAADLPLWNAGRTSVDFYYWYSGALALNQYDGPDSPRPQRGRYWGPWHQSLQKALLENQVRNDRLCAHGSWEAVDRWGFEGGRVYATALNVLTFEVYYRYANAFGIAAKPKSKEGR